VALYIKHQYTFHLFQYRVLW